MQPLAPTLFPCLISSPFRPRPGSHRRLTVPFPEFHINLASQLLVFEGGDVGSARWACWWLPAVERGSTAHLWASLWLIFTHDPAQKTHITSWRAWVAPFLSSPTESGGKFLCLFLSETCGLRSEVTVSTGCLLPSGGVGSTVGRSPSGGCVRVSLWLLFGS